MQRIYKQHNSMISERDLERRGHKASIAYVPSATKWTKSTRKAASGTASKILPCMVKIYFTALR